MQWSKRDPQFRCFKKALANSLGILVLTNNLHILFRKWIRMSEQHLRTSVIQKRRQASRSQSKTFASRNTPIVATITYYILWKAFPAQQVCWLCLPKLIHLPSLFTIHERLISMLLAFIQLMGNELCAAQHLVNWIRWSTWLWKQKHDASASIYCGRRQCYKHKQQE